MNSTSKEPVIVVALRSKENAEHFLSFAETVALQAKAKLKLVHVHDPVISIMTAGIKLHEADATWEAMSRDLTSEEAVGPDLSYELSLNQHFSDLLQKLDQRLVAEYVILDGSVEDAVMNYAHSINAQLLLIGSHLQHAGFFTSLFSRTLQFMSDTKVPVMVIPTNSELLRPDKEMRILIADDMEDDLTQLMTSLTLTSYFPKCSFIHFNVRSFPDFVSVPISYGIIGYYGDFAYPYYSYENLVNTRQKSDYSWILHELRTRFYRASAKSGLSVDTRKYEPHCALGDIAEEINKATARWMVDIVIYGGHHRATFWDLLRGSAVSDRLKLKNNAAIVISPLRKVA